LISSSVAFGATPRPEKREDRDYPIENDKLSRARAQGKRDSLVRRASQAPFRGAGAAVGAGVEADCGMPASASSQDMTNAGSVASVFMVLP
jgi:hypothetical protein